MTRKGPPQHFSPWGWEVLLQYSGGSRTGRWRRGRRERREAPPHQSMGLTCPDRFNTSPGPLLRRIGLRPCRNHMMAVSGFVKSWKERRTWDPRCMSAPATAFRTAWLRYICSDGLNMSPGHLLHQPMPPPCRNHMMAVSGFVKSWKERRTWDPRCMSAPATAFRTARLRLICSDGLNMSPGHLLRQPMPPPCRNHMMAVSGFVKSWKERRTWDPRCMSAPATAFRTARLRLICSDGLNTSPGHLLRQPMPPPCRNHMMAVSGFVKSWK